MAVVLIGIDDTDNDTSPGTGKLSQRLAKEIVRRGAKPLGITRHQFLLDERIAYTSHNSGACIAVEWAGPLSELAFTADLIAGWAAEGSDPGICITDYAGVDDEVVKWGWAATREVLRQEHAVAIAEEHGICLRVLGGSGDGIIGALASVGLRADGNEGRFLDLPGLRTLGEVVDHRQLKELGIEVDHHLPVGAGASDMARFTGDGALYKTMNWVRPRLVRGRAVWPVEWSEDERAWIGIDRKKSRPLE